MSMLTPYLASASDKTAFQYQGNGEQEAIATPTKTAIIETIKADPRTAVFGQLIDNEPLLDTFRHYISEFKNISVIAPCNEALASNASIQQILNNSLYYLSVDDVWQQEQDGAATPSAQLHVKATLLNGAKIKLRIRGDQAEIREPGCSSVIGEPIKVNDATISIVDQVPSVPKDVSQTLQEMDQSMTYKLFRNLSYYPASSDNIHTTGSNSKTIPGEYHKEKTTIFAPVNSAFGTVDPALLSDTVREQMARWHIVSGAYYSKQWQQQQQQQQGKGSSTNGSAVQMKSLAAGQSLEIRNGELWLAKILTPDVLLADGSVLHIIDRVVWMKQVGVVATSSSSSSTAAQTRINPFAVLHIAMAGLALFGRSPL
ncbi:hypothetical protein BDB00DRAFT_929208 [Zychaea mexicana]|uniref:uncharacterized protein n=1 Tax=Zychaea mexicana TaxID=64656 RepID=UPI0022FE0B2A|nr:uncharacterized protein BDB00DRAFT_929208 [Zychaea mexicana]KAI9493146.1 hypothetical protein BDB00DRAFT_929208 [Zychaea mexicana]